MMDLLSLSRNAAVFIGVIALLRLLFSRYLPRTAFVVLWLAAAVRMLCPFRLPSAVSVWGLLRRSEASGTARIRRYFLGSVSGVPVKEALPNTFDFLGKVWLFVAVLLALCIAALYWGCLRATRKAEPLGNGVYVSGNISAPRLCGILRPRILLPEGVGEELLPYILLHERVHLRRGDNLWKLLALAAAVVHWFNPAAWLLVALLGKDLELSCDEWVLRSLCPEQRRSYALSLIAVAERPQGRSPIVCGFAQNPLEERIRNIMTNRKKSMVALSAATAMILCTTSAFATDAPVSVDAEALKEGNYVVTAVGEPSSADSAATEVNVTVCDGSSLGVLGFSEKLSLFTAEEYAAYLEEQKVALLAEIEAGNLSQETYDMTIRDMEEVLEGIKDGSMMAVKPFENEDGVVTEIVMSTPDVAEKAGYTVNYEVEENGIISVSIGDQLYTVTPSTEK